MVSQIFNLDDFRKGDHFTHAEEENLDASFFTLSELELLYKITYKAMSEGWFRDTRISINEQSYAMYGLYHDKDAPCSLGVRKYTNREGT